MSAAAFSARRVLLALDGCALSRELLEAALRHCVHLSSRLDILLVNPPRAPASLLAVLLLKLEHSGVDYRLTSTQGDLAGEVARYLRRYRGVTTVVAEGVEPLRTPAEQNCEWVELGMPTP
ncbi:MAG: hypothetical protein HZB71_06695 [Betaproteobacteria bacterium]|nr:hypothetical protein [Betaproteobacteria bacterium]